MYTNDLTGLVVGRLTIIHKLDRRSQSGCIYWQCKCSCGTTPQVLGSNLKSGNTKSRGCFAADRLKVRGKDHPAWKGGAGTNKDRNGYKVVMVNGRSRRAHAVVMEQTLGRPLVKGENVHHKNGVKDDNRPENLELWVSLQPSGQRPEDLVAWAEEILRRYKTT